MCIAHGANGTAGRDEKERPCSRAKATREQRQASPNDRQLLQSYNREDLYHTPLLKFLQERVLVTGPNLWLRSKQTFSSKCHMGNISDFAGHPLTFHKYSALSLEHESCHRQHISVPET